MGINSMNRHLLITQAKNLSERKQSVTKLYKQTTFCKKTIHVFTLLQHKTSLNLQY